MKILATRLSVVCQVAGIAGAALGLYLMTGWVAAERKNVALMDIEIARVQSDIAKLSIELGSRGRMGQLERWNSEVLALSAPKPDQFVADGLRLAALEGRGDRPALPLNPAVTGQTAPQKVAYAPAEMEAPAPQSSTPMIQPAVATSTRSEPLLRHAAFVRSEPVALDRAAPPPPSRPATAKAGKAAASGLLPDDIGRLIAAEERAGRDKKTSR